MHDNVIQNDSVKEKIVFAVGSPLQLLNAIEARGRFHQNDETYLLVFWAKPIEYQQMQSMLDNQWNNVHIYSINKVFKLFYPWSLAKVLNPLRQASRLYLGYPFKIRAHIANVLHAKETLFLDDGNASLILAQQLGECELYKKHRVKWYDQLLSRKVDLTYAKEACFFTAYPDMHWPTDRIIENDYRCIKKSVIQGELNTEVLFIGSAIAGSVVSQEQERHLIRAMADFYKNTRVLYALHRFENFEYFQNEFKDLNIQFIHFDCAIELALFQREIYPKKISSFCSSALNTLAMLYDCQLEVLAIPQSWMEISVAKRLEIIYEDFAQREIFIQDITEEINNVA